MRYLLPLLVCAAVGALVVFLVKTRDETVLRPEDKPVKERAKEDEVVGPLGKPRTTPTALNENRWLSELERVMGRKDLKRARYFRQRVAEQIDEIVGNDKLRNNLLTLIRKHGIESDDPNRRDILLPLLRVIRHPEATALVANEYYRAKNESEQMVMLEAMSHDYHDPKQAAVWAVEKTLNSDSAEVRELAFELILNNSNDDALIVDTAFQIYEATTRPEQAQKALMTLTSRGREHERVRDFVRRKLKSPRLDEVMTIAHGMESWATERDAAQLETLAEEFPGMGGQLRDVARRVREARRFEAEAGPDSKIEVIPPDTPDPGAKDG